MTRRGERWTYRAFLALYGVALLMIVGQLVRANHSTVQNIERDMGPITVPVDPLPCTDNDTIKLAASRNPNIVCGGDL